MQVMGGGMMAGWLQRYELWNRAICQHFFNPMYAGRPVYMQVDTDTLSEIAPSICISEENAESDFVQVMRELVHANGEEPFWRFKRTAADGDQAGSECGDPPLSIALLGLCVLAASKMHTDKQRQYSAGNYYIHLNTLLGRSAAGMPPGFDNPVTACWQDLRKWLNVDNGGRLGLATAAAPTEGPGKYIAYPISQCLFRKVDRDRLPNFFAFARINPGTFLEPQDLVQPLKRWCRHATCNLSLQAKELLQTGGSESILQVAQIVAAEALSWNGEVRDDAGRRVAPIDLVVLTPRAGSYKIEFYPRRPSDFPAGCFHAALGTFDLEPIADSAWYEPIPVRAEEVLERGLELRKDSFVLRWPGGRTIVLKPDTQNLGGYVSVSQADLGEHVMVLTQDAERLSRFLERCAEPGWRRAAAARGLPAGWHIFLDVRLQALAFVDSYPDFACLIPARRASLSLEGGLKLDASTWLVGAEPLLRIARPEGGPVDIVVDSQTVSRTEEATALLDLSQLGLSAGPHVLAIGGNSRQIHTMRAADFAASRMPVSETSMLAHVLKLRDNQFEATFPSPRRTGARMPTPGELWVTGAALVAGEADLPENLPQPVVLRGGAKRYALLGPLPGMILECHDPAAPPAGVRAPIEARRAFQVSPPFQVVWAISDFRSGRSAYMVRGLSPRSGDPLPEGDVNAWTAWLKKSLRRAPTGEAATLWRAYVEMAKALT